MIASLPAYYHCAASPFHSFVTTCLLPRLSRMLHMIYISCMSQATFAGRSHSCARECAVYAAKAGCRCVIFHFPPFLQWCKRCSGGLWTLAYPSIRDRHTAPGARARTRAEFGQRFASWPSGGVSHKGWRAKGTYVYGEFSVNE